MSHGERRLALQTRSEEVEINVQDCDDFEAQIYSICQFRPLLSTSHVGMSGVEYAFIVLHPRLSSST